MKTAVDAIVDAIVVGRERRYNRRFEQMCGHYLVEPVACTPASGRDAPLRRHRFEPSGAGRRHAPCL